MREGYGTYTSGGGRSPILEAGRGGTWLRPLLLVLAALALALAAVLVVRPGIALAAPSPLVDDTTAHFEAGQDNGTQVSPDIGNGAVTLAPTVELNEDFNGTTLPSGWSVTQTWNPGGSATVRNGELTLDGVQVQSNATFGPGRILEFAATYRSGQFENIGFATDFNGAQSDSWAAFGTASNAGQLLARTKVSGSNTFLDTPVGGSELLGSEHVYRIEWATNEIRYFIDGELVHTQASAISNQMRVSASDFPRDGQNPSVDYFRVTSSYPASGQFTSRSLEADAVADWGELSATTQTPNGTSVSFETRSGNTATPDASWSEWQSVGAGGVIQSPDGRYIQYRANLSTTDASATPVLERVEISYEVADEAGPTITPKRPKGQTKDRSPKVVALVSDETSELSKEDIELYIDGRARDFSYDPATDTLTHQSGRLSYGRHTVRIEATDEAGNETITYWRFKIVKRR